MTLTGILWPLFGGALIGLAAAALLLFNGRILGVSGIVGRLFPLRAGDIAWRVAFVGGLVFGGLVMTKSDFPAFPAHLDRSPLWMLVAGLLVGFGTRLGNGCTSGHGVCGISRLSRRSIIATMVFIASGAATVFVVQHLLGW